MALLKFAPCHGLGFLHNFSDGDNIARRPDSIFHLPRISSRSKGRRRSLSGGQLRCSASKWADRLFSDFNDPTDSSSVVTLAPERQFTLPIDFYQVLGAETHFLGDGIKRAYEARVRKVPHECYSDEALTGRRQILHSACDTLANPRSRGDYNQGLIENEAETLMREVPWNKVPGALCLLQEVGEVEVVIQAGQRLLQDQLPKSFKRDVMLAMALSYVDISREAMAESSPDIIKSCEALERALQILQEGGGRSLAPDLQEQIEETLEEITPRCILELLALPLDEEHRAKREEGLQGARNILWAVGGGGAVAPLGGFTREEFMNEAFSHMTAAEQVDLFAATPNSIPAESFEIYMAALAHIAEGFIGKRPHLIQEADALFLQLQQTNGTPIEIVSDFSAAEQELDFALERGMCSLLLGELDDCRAWLGLDNKKSPYRDPLIVDFILANSDEAEEDMLLPGLCKLLESWLTEIVFPRFKDTRGLKFKLRDYYDDSGVLSYLERLERGRGSPLAAAAAIVRIGAGAGAALDNVKASAIQTLKKVFPLGNERGGKEARAHNAPTISSQAQSTKDAPHKDYPNSNVYKQPRMSNEYISNLSDASEFAKPTTESWGENSGPGGGEDLFLLSKLSKEIGSFGVKIVCASVVVGVLAIAGLRYLPAQYSSTKTLKEVPFSTTIGDNLNHGAPKMDARLADNLVRKWQMLKSQALGPDHAVSRLSEILDGQMLKIWSERAKDIAEHGWFWEYSLLGLTIESVTVSTDGMRAMVEATLQEAARLIDTTHPEHNDSYRSTYTTRYEMTNVKGTWKITDGAVLRS